MSGAPSKEFWNERYRTGQTPWDYGGVPQEFEELLSRQAAPLRILIPGCGSAYELLASLQKGHDAVGIDLSDEAVDRVRPQLGADADRLQAGDFFTSPFSDGGFDLIYERTFLCAIDPAMRAAYAHTMAALLRPGGLLAGYFLYGHEPDPPPYPLAPGEEKELFEPAFDLIESHRSTAPLPMFAGMEQWQIWQRKPER